MGPAEHTPTLVEQQKHLLTLSPASPELLLLGMVLPVETIVALKSAGIPLRWQPLGACYTLKRFEEAARHVLTACG
ncbi:hypothetical protein [Deinococcus cellulosilyticus]|uniref:Uncharacterized protein n=1 Tax=Deinococcus cellulosilyticus (strain DSM 18568 / NBRC 106333 / KACC 11606 / 5516J-15) TaxID=1223518 RepID=A0A511N482_DEIC1|nr:hypothetical protein [Deinococcus cellulosilyticus]GEM47635.1 hypothetical protein DC3_32700 [Deinococcus cellulosilyticus NBRC 106333 = KACC 11606]